MRKFLIDLLSTPSPPPPGGFVDSLPEAFGALDENGEVFVIGYRGEWYTIAKSSLRTRLHNWLVNQHNRQMQDDDARHR